MQARKRVLGILFALGIAIIALFIIGCIKYTRAFADKGYLEIYHGDFVPTGIETQNENYYVVYADYTGTEALPQGRYRSYTNAKVEIDCNKEKPVILSHLQARNSSSKVAFYFYKVLPEGLEDMQPFNDSVTKVFFPEGMLFDAHADYATTYAGICFCEDIVFEREGEGWKVADRKDADGDTDADTEKDNDTNSDIETEPTPTRVYVEYSKETISSFAFNHETKRLEASIRLPYTAREDVVYEGDLAYTVNGATYTGKVQASQKGNTSTLFLSFENSEIFKSASGVSICLSETKFTSETDEELILTGNVTYYGYYDDSWLTEQCAEIFRQVNDEVFYEKVPLSNEKYIFPVDVAVKDTLFIGWEYKDALYPKGAEIAINGDNMLIEIKAKYITFELIDGASIRYGEDSTQSGIRFVGEVLSAGFIEHSDYVMGLGIILMPTDFIKEDKEFTLDNYVQTGQIENEYLTKEDVVFDSSGSFTFHVALINVSQNNFNRSYIGRAYAKIRYATGEGCAWGEKIENRSVYQVAVNALNDENREDVFTDTQIELLQAYTQKVLDVKFDGKTITLVNVSDKPFATQTSIVLLKSVVTVRLVTETTYLPCVSYNGKRVRDFEQSWQEGVLTVSFSIQDA